MVEWKRPCLRVDVSESGAGGVYHSNQLLSAAHDVRTLAVEPSNNAV